MSQPPFGPPASGYGPGYGPGHGPGPGRPPAPAPQANGFAAPVGPRSKAPIWLALSTILALGATILVILLVREDSGGAGTGGSAPGPRDVVVAFMKAAETGDSEEAKKYTCDDMDEDMSPTEGMPDDVSYEVGKEKIDGDTAEVPVKVMAYDDEVTMTMILEKKKSTWEICDYTYGE